MNGGSKRPRAEAAARAESTEEEDSSEGEDPPAPASLGRPSRAAALATLSKIDQSLAREGEKDEDEEVVAKRPRLPERPPDAASTPASSIMAKLAAMQEGKQQGQAASAPGAMTAGFNCGKCGGRKVWKAARCQSPCPRILGPPAEANEEANDSEQQQEEEDEAGFKCSKCSGRKTSKAARCKGPCPTAVDLAEEEAVPAAVATEPAAVATKPAAVSTKPAAVATNPVAVVTKPAAALEIPGPSPPGVAASSSSAFEPVVTSGVAASGSAARSVSVQLQLPPGFRVKPGAKPSRPHVVDDDDDDEVPKPPPRGRPRGGGTAAGKRRQRTPSPSSDDDDDDDDDDEKEEVPVQRTARPTRRAAAAAIEKVDNTRAFEKAAGMQFKVEKETRCVATLPTREFPARCLSPRLHLARALFLPPVCRPVWNSKAYQAAVERVLLQGVYANRCIRIGDKFQAELEPMAAEDFVAGVGARGDGGYPISPKAEDCYPEGRVGDERVALEYAPNAAARPPRPPRSPGAATDGHRRSLAAAAGRCWPPLAAAGRCWPLLAHPIAARLVASRRALRLMHSASSSLLRTQVHPAQRAAAVPAHPNSHGGARGSGSGKGAGRDGGRDRRWARCAHDNGRSAAVSRPAAHHRRL